MTITTYTDKEIALKAQLAAMTAERDEYQQAADKMAWDHKEVRDRWIPMFDALQAESHTLRQQLAEAQARINSLEETEKQLSDNVIWQAGEIAKHLDAIEALRIDADCFNIWVYEAWNSPSAICNLLMECETPDDYRAKLLPIIEGKRKVIDKAMGGAA